MNRNLFVLGLLLGILMIGLICLREPVKGQDVEISDFKGLITDADLEDIPNEAATSLKNLIPENGRLVKTFGIGSKIDTALATDSIYGLATYINENLTMDGGADDRAYIALKVGEDNKAMLFVWTDSTWDSLTVSKGHLQADFPTTYHKQDYNPVIAEGNEIRFLPGNSGEPDGSNEGKGIWVGYIDRKYFDEGYSPTADFYGYNTDISDINNYSIAVTGINSSGCNIEDTERYYKISDVYDYTQENLYYNINNYSGDSTYSREIRFKIDDTFNKRITSIKLYKSDSYLSGYGRVANVDLISSSNNTVQDTAFNGRHYIYIPDLQEPIWKDTFAIAAIESVDVTHGIFKVLGNHDAFFDSITLFTVYDCDPLEAIYGLVSFSSSYANGTTYVSVVAGTPRDTVGAGYIRSVEEYAITINSDTFVVEPIDLPDIYKISKTPKYFDSDLFSATTRTASSCTLWFADSNWVAGYRQDFSTESNMYTGSCYVFIDSSYTNNTLSYSHILYTDNNSSKNIRQISSNTGEVIQFNGSRIDTNNIIGTISLLYKSNYFFTDEGSYTYLYYYDIGITAGDDHPLTGEVSIKVNGKYAATIGGRLWQGNIVLDPGGENEAHSDWGSFSVAGQYDVNPVSDPYTFPIPDKYGGPVTGVVEMYGNPLYTKKFSLNLIDTKSSTAPADWRIIQSTQNIGNVAPRGLINVRGDVFFPGYDYIYRVSPNVFAETDKTPAKHLAISTPIQDTYDALSASNKEDIIVEYDQYKDELIWKLGNAYYAYEVGADQWRQIETQVTAEIFALDEVGNILAYDSSDQKIFSTGVAESVNVEWQSKTLVLDDVTRKDLKYQYLTYTSSEDSLRSIFYFDGTARDTVSYPPTSADTTVRRAVRGRGMKFYNKIHSKDGSSTDDQKIYKNKITR